MRIDFASQGSLCNASQEGVDGLQRAERMWSGLRKLESSAKRWVGRRAKDTSTRERKRGGGRWSFAYILMRAE